MLLVTKTMRSMHGMIYTLFFDNDVILFIYKTLSGRPGGYPNDEMIKSKKKSIYYSPLGVHYANHSRASFLYLRKYYFLSP